MNKRFTILCALTLIACETKPETSASHPVANSSTPSPSAAPSGAAMAAISERSELGRAVDEVLALRSYKNLTISRSGKYVAYSVPVEPLISPNRRAIFLVDRTSPAIEAGQVTAAPDKKIDERFPEFSPDGKSLAFLSDTEGKGKRQLYIVDVSNLSAPRKVGHFDGALGILRFSPDGKKIAVLHTERAATGASSPDAPVVVSIHDTPQRVAIVDVATGEKQIVSPPNLHVHEFDWAPDGQSLVFVGSDAADHFNYFVAKLYAIASSGGEPRLVFAPQLQLGDPRFSPDGRWISFVSGLISDEGNTGGDLFVVPAAGGEPKNLTSGRKSTITAARWRSDSRSLLVSELAEDHFALSRIALENGDSEMLFRADATFRQFQASVDGEHVVFMHDSFDAAPSIWSGPPNSPAPLGPTQQRFGAPWGDVKVIHASSDEYSIQSFLIAPKQVESGRKYPLITLVHGGPASSWVRTPIEYAVLAAKGYFLLLPNPRGSFGRGAAFQQANVKDFGHGDLRDIRASVRAALAAAPIDENRIGIAGWSYGGFMAMWAPTQTSEFRASVAGAGVSNWLSYQGQTDTTGWMRSYFGASVYDDRAVYSKSEPIAFIKQNRTPTLLLVGENDTDCPAPQSREYWQALGSLGIATELVVYPNEAHGFTQPAHRRDRVERTAAWFDRHLAPR